MKKETLQHLLNTETTFLSLTTSVFAMNNNLSLNILSKIANIFAPIYFLTITNYLLNKKNNYYFNNIEYKFEKNISEFYKKK